MTAIESGRNEQKYYSKGPVNGVTEAVKCNYVIYWSGDHRMDLVDKWTTENKINDGNKDTLKTYWEKFDKYVHPQTNKLIAVVELKWLLQGTMSLEDFHTKAMLTSHPSWL